MIYLILALVLMTGLAGWLTWRGVGMGRALARTQARCHELQKERAIRQNLQRVCDRREAEVRRLKAQVKDYEEQFREMESRASDLNMSLFHESGLRILAEKEDGAKRLKMEQLEKQLETAQLRLRESEAAARETERQLRAELATREGELTRLRAASGRRAARRALADQGGLDQVTLDDILGDAPRK